MAISELPPSSKKLVSSPIGEPRTSREDPADDLLGDRSAGARCRLDAAANTGAGRALRSSLPAGVSGSESNTMIDDGTMYPGKTLPDELRQHPGLDVGSRRR